MGRFKLFLFVFFYALVSNNFIIAQFKSPKIAFDLDDNQTATYHEVVQFYNKIAKASSLVKVSNFGMTDSGFPLQEVIIAKNGDHTPTKSSKSNKAILLINNGIHAGEPEGIDASMMFVRDILASPSMQNMLDHMTIVIIPVYNIGGCLNRGSFSRANQFGPEAYGFRGNAKNYDLNRDFVKCDSKNAISFNQLFNKWNPHVFVDTHTSNGADYQYTMTLIATQKDKLHPTLSKLMTEEMIPFLYTEMGKTPYEMIPYVNTRGLPETGIYAFLETPRYSTGYAALHHTIGFMPETHMLKPFKDRVWSTYRFLNIVSKYVSINSVRLITTKRKVLEEVKNQTSFPLGFAVNQEIKDSLLFKGYEAVYKKSDVTGLDRLYYDKSKPWSKYIPYYNSYKAMLEVNKPSAYVIPQGYDEVILRLKTNGVHMFTLKKDTLINVERYYIDKYDTSKMPYEGHFNHSNVQLSKEKSLVKFYKGDILIKTNQSKNRYIVETLEPQAADSYFAWNFFDGILSQKEHFSNYVFEDLATELLEKNPTLKQTFEEKKNADPAFAKSDRAMLNYIYQNSPYYEPTHNLYPVGRVID